MPQAHENEQVVRFDTKCNRTQKPLRIMEMRDTIVFSSRRVGTGPGWICAAAELKGSSATRARATAKSNSRHTNNSLQEIRCQAEFCGANPEAWGAPLQVRGRDGMPDRLESLSYGGNGNLRNSEVSGRRMTARREETKRRQVHPRFQMVLPFSPLCTSAALPPVFLLLCPRHALARFLQLQHGKMRAGCHPRVHSKGPGAREPEGDRS